MALLDAAKQTAQAQGKIVLVAYGAEWCVWCHSFAQTIAGMAGPTVVYHEGEAYEMDELSTSQPELAEELRAYDEATFVVVHIEAKYSPDSESVMAAVGAPIALGIPQVFTLKDGQYAAEMRSVDDLPGLERRADLFLFYRGYDRAILLDELKRIAAAAQ